MNELISVIVPVYNVAKYLPRCIESILRQTYPHFELILVDDGSPDKSGKICDKYAQKDARIRVIHKENGGVSSARNAGLDVAQGEYISFIDSDDWVREDYLEKLLAPMLKYDVQMVVGGIETRNFLIGRNDMQEGMLDFDNLNYQEAEEFFIGQGGSRGPVCKLLVTEIISNNALRFDGNTSWGEDACFIFEYLKLCQRIYKLHDSLYYYNRLVLSSATRKIHPQKVEFRKRVFERFVAIIERIQLEKQEKRRLIMEFQLFYFIAGVKDICSKDKASIEEIEDWYNYFLPWNIENDYAENHPYQLVKIKDFDGLYEIYSPKKIRLIKRLLISLYCNIYLKLKIFIIERARDELKAYNKKSKKS